MVNNISVSQNLVVCYLFIVAMHTVFAAFPFYWAQIRSDTLGLKLNEKVVSKIANYCIGWQKRYIHFLPISAEWDQDQNFK